MATGTFSGNPAPPPVQSPGQAPGQAAVQRSDPAAAPPSASEGFILEQIEKTRSSVRLVELIGAVLTLIIGALGCLLLLAVVDHWLLTLGFWLRLSCLLGMLAAAGWWIATRIAPLVRRRINPVYAAHTIEQADPSLKNSLINFLMFRGRRRQLHGVVYDALGQRAASDLAHAPVETAIDRNPLIRLGYVLAGVLAVCAAYKILSPKDPIQTIARVAAPWAEIDPPSRVSIRHVAPGDVAVFYGKPVEVSAELRGVAGGDEVRLVYNTADGQAVDQALPMALDSAGLNYQAALPPDGRGVTQALQYRIEAGDAATRWFHVEVLPAPTITVEQVGYEYPRYTGMPPESVVGGGDIDGLEGTFVTIRARANQDIASAYIEFDPLLDKAASSGGRSSKLALRKVDERTVEAGFHLRLRKDRRTPLHSRYCLRFKSQQGHANEDPIVHAVSVKPDIAPLVEILQPAQRLIQVPADGRVENRTASGRPGFRVAKAQPARRAPRSRPIAGGAGRCSRRADRPDPSEVRLQTSRS